MGLFKRMLGKLEKKSAEKESKEGNTPIIQKYQRILDQAHFRIRAHTWILFSVVISTMVGISSLLLIALSAGFLSPILAIIGFFVAADLLLGYPYYLASNRINAIEEMLPDALKQMADTLKAGGTYEFALREIATSQYGVLSNEMDLVLRKIEKGQNLENSLRGFAENIDSRLIKRSVSVIIDSIKAGAGLADVLDEISDDIRAIHRMHVERRIGTALQVLFMVAAGAFVAPIILGMVSTIIEVFMSAAIGIGTDSAVIAEATAVKGLIVLLMQLYIFVEVTASGVMISLMREGRISKSIIYIPMLLLIAYAIYYLSLAVSGAVIGGFI